MTIAQYGDKDIPVIKDENLKYTLPFSKTQKQEMKHGSSMTRKATPLLRLLRFLPKMPWNTGDCWQN